MTSLAPLLALGILAGAPSTPDCLALYHGLGAPPDLPAARRCLEAALAAPCQGAPADLARLELAAMYLDAQGGPADPARAAALLRGCAEDRSAYELRRAFASRAPTGAFSLCRDVSGGPPLLRECTEIEARLAAQARGDAARRVRAALPEAARGAFDAAEGTWSRFLAAEVDRVLARVRAPGAAPLVRATIVALRERERAAWLDGLCAQPSRLEPCPAAERGRAEEGQERARRDAADGVDDDALAALGASQDAWASYRDAESGWLRRWRGEDAGASAACAMIRQRARMLEVHEPEDVERAGK